MTTQEELTLKETMWIKSFNSVNEGYNETDSIFKCGGNTYQSKTKEELAEISNKIRVAKEGTKPPMSRKIKRVDLFDKSTKIYDTVISCAKDCSIKNGKTSIVVRLNKHVNKPFKGRFVFEYLDE